MLFMKIFQPLKSFFLNIEDNLQWSQYTFMIMHFNLVFLNHVELVSLWPSLCVFFLFLKNKNKNHAFQFSLLRSCGIWWVYDWLYVFLFSFSLWSIFYICIYKLNVCGASLNTKTSIILIYILYNLCIAI